MSVLYQAIRILVPVGICIYIAGKLKKGRVNTHDMLFWVLLAGFLVISDLFPWSADRLAELLGISSGRDMILQVMVLVLFIRLLFLDVRTSQTEHRLRVLAEELAIREKASEDSRKKRWRKPEMKLYIRKEAAASEEEKSGFAP